MFKEIDQKSFDNIWQELIYPLLDQIKDNDDEQIIVYNYFENNLDKVIVPSNYKDIFIQTMKKYTKKSEKKFTSRFGLISIEGIEHTKNFLINYQQN